MDALTHNAASPRWPQRPFLGLTLLVYWLLVMGLWGMYAVDRGLPFETGFPMNCQLGIRQCLIYGDDLRPYNSLFLGLAHLLSRGNGSYVSYQLLYGFLWWGRGVLTFLIFSRVWRPYPIAPFLIGTLVIVHATDQSLNFIGQLHQFGFMFFLVLAVYLVVEGVLANRWITWLGLVLAALPALYISLWTYESQYFIILSIPLVLLALRPKLDLKFILTALLWYILPVIYGYLQFQRYTANRVNNYQTSILRPDLSFSTIAQDWLIHLQHSLQFWRWGKTTAAIGVGGLAPAIAGLCTVSFLVGAYLLFGRHADRQHLPPRRSLWIGLGIGTLILILSFPIYLLIAGNTGFWRTQMLSGFGAAIVLGCSILLLAYLLPKESYRVLFAIVTCAIVVFSGVQTGVKLQGFHEHRWQIHRDIMVQISHLIPDVQDGTLILLTNVPRDSEKDGFGAELWFDFPIQLLYPGKKLVGYYLFEDGKPPDNPWIFTKTGMQWQKKGMGQEVEQVTYGDIIVLKYNADGSLSLLEEFPTEILPEPFNPAAYNPHARMPKNFISNSSIRMFAR